MGNGDVSNWVKILVGDQKNQTNNCEQTANHRKVIIYKYIYVLHKGLFRTIS